jgi:hypothetical protein
VPFEPPSPEEALKLASQLLLSDGGRTIMSHYMYGQSDELGLKYMIRAMRLPRWIKWIWAKWLRLIGENIWANLVENWNEKSGFEQQKLVVQRLMALLYAVTDQLVNNTVPHFFKHGLITS